MKRTWEVPMKVQTDPQANQSQTTTTISTKRENSVSSNKILSSLQKVTALHASQQARHRRNFIQQDSEI